MPRLFPVDTTRSGRCRATCVVWDIEGYSIPEGLGPFSISKQIKSAIVKEGYYGDVSIRVYGDENTWLLALQDKLHLAGFHVYSEKGDARSRLYMSLTDHIYWTFNMRYPSNFLMLSQNKEKIEQDPKFCLFREALENKGFYVALAQPETLIDPDSAFKEADFDFDLDLESAYRGYSSNWPGKELSSEEETAPEWLVDFLPCFQGSKFLK